MPFFVGGGEIDSLESWILLDYQNREHIDLFIEQVRLAGELALKDRNSWVMFSGSSTRDQAGPLTEAESYAQLFRRMGYCSHPRLLKRHSCERGATDSYLNLSFSAMRIREVSGQFATRYSCITLGAKGDRYAFHAETLRLDEWGFEFFSCGNPELDGGALREGEVKTKRQFKEVPHGNTGPLREKRNKRTVNPVYPAYGNIDEHARRYMDFLAQEEETEYSDWYPWDE